MPLAYSLRDFQAQNGWRQSSMRPASQSSAFQTPRTGRCFRCQRAEEQALCRCSGCYENADVLAVENSIHAYPLRRSHELHPPNFPKPLRTCRGRGNWTGQTIARNSKNCIYSTFIDGLGAWLKISHSDII